MNAYKKTVLYDAHLELGAKFVPFSGWEMPVNYSTGIIAEHFHTREHVSLFDICHMGEFRLKGKNAASSLDKIVARTVIDQKSGLCRYNFLLNEKGTVVDDIIVYRIADDEFFIVVNAGTKDGDFEWIKEHLSAGDEFIDESDFTAKLDLQGPESAHILAKTGLSLDILPDYYKFINAKIAGVSSLISRTGYTGELGYEIYIHTDDALKVWEALLSDEQVKPAGLGARDTLRLEMAYPLYGHELNDKTTPIEAGFGRILDTASERNFIGRDALRNSQPSKKLVGIELEGRRAVKEGAEIFFEGKQIGYVSSGSYSPSLGKAIALGFIDSDFLIDNSYQLEIFFKKNIFKGCFSDLPFYKDGTAKKKLK